MRIKLDNRHEIMTEHPASHYGAGVLLIDGAQQPAYGPGDPYPESCPELADLLGAPHMSCAEAVQAIIERRKPSEEYIRAGVAIYPSKLDADDRDLINKWLSQQP